MSFKKHSVKNSYGRLSKYWSATDAGILPQYKANYFGTGADGDVTISADTELGTTEDGDILVKNYGNLTIDAAKTLTVDNRCRGLVLFVDGNLVVNGTISMTARGAWADPVGGHYVDKATGTIMSDFCVDWARSQHFINPHRTVGRNLACVKIDSR